MKTFSHTPLRPPRRETIGEQVFLHHWQILMATSPSDESDYAQCTWLEQILYNLYERITQRHATVAASLITWMGTNYGLALIAAARAEEALDPSKGPELAWLKAWAVFNRRSRGVNSGVRILEHLLSPPEAFSSNGELCVCPSLSPEDFEVAEHLCMWFGTGQGSRFIEGAQREIGELKRAARYRCGRIEPATQLKGVVAVWNTPDHTRDSEELCMGGQSFGGWAPAAEGKIAAYVDRSGQRVEQSFAGLEEAKRWVEARAAEFVSRLTVPLRRA